MDEITIVADLGGKRRKVMVKQGDNVLHSDVIDPASHTARGRFIQAVKEKLPAVKVEDLDTELLKLADAPDPKGDDKANHAEPSPNDLLAAMPAEARAEADAMLRDPMLIKTVIDDVAALNVAGERELIATVFMIGISRLLSRPLAGIVQGPSSSGKSYLIEKTVQLFPPEAIMHATQMTPQALFHMKPGTLVHRFIVAGERSRVDDDERAEATRALRAMLSSGKLTKLMPVKQHGEIVTVSIEQDGPIAFIESTTLAKVFDEDQNRCVMLHTDEQAEQTRRIIGTLASAYQGGAAETDTERIIKRHHALQRMLERRPVIIPFAERLGELFPSEQVEVRRAFPHLLGMVQASALLYQRQRAIDHNDAIIATDDDYSLARRLFVKPMSKLLGGRFSDPARRFYDRLTTWARDEFTSTEAKSKETRSRSSVYGWLSELQDAGILRQVEQQRGRTPARWMLTGQRPDDNASNLPTVEDVFGATTWNHGHEPQVIARK